MADNIFNVLSSADQIKSNYSKYADLYKDSSSDIVNQETFLQLLVAEMSNQDPLEPTSNTEFISQLAQFSSMQYAMDSSKYAESNYASGLVGKIATASRTEGTQLVSKTGTVEEVRKSSDNSYVVTIDGEDFPLSSVSSIKPAETVKDTSTDFSASSLSASIAQASMMIGMLATVKTDTLSGTVTAGLIDAIKVKDGKLYAVINSKDYSLDSLEQVTYAYYDNGSSGNGNSNNTDNTVSGGTTVDGTASDNKVDDGSQRPDNSSDDDVQSTAVGAEMEI